MSEWWNLGKQDKTSKHAAESTTDLSTALAMQIFGDQIGAMNHVMKISQAVAAAAHCEDNEEVKYELKREADFAKQVFGDNQLSQKCLAEIDFVGQKKV